MASDFFKGLISAPFTAMTPAGGLNLGMIERQAEGLVRQGVIGAFVCGTTGEGASLTTEERMQVAARWAEVAGESLHLIVHVGHNSLAEARALAGHVARIGADAIAAVGPNFFKPASVGDLAEFCGVIAAAGDPLPFYYYHIPSMSGVSLPMVPFLERGAEAIPTLRGIKYTHGDLVEYRQCVQLAGNRFQILWGFDELLLPALSIGARSAVGSTYNYAAPIYTRMLQAFGAGDMPTARQCVDRSLAVIEPLVRFGTLRTGKACMKILGIDCGPPRLPLKPLSPEEYRQVEQMIEKVGLEHVAGVSHAV